MRQHYSVGFVASHRIVCVEGDLLDIANSVLIVRVQNVDKISKESSHWLICSLEAERCCTSLGPIYSEVSSDTSLAAPPPPPRMDHTSKPKRCGESWRGFTKEKMLGRTVSALEW